MAKSYKVTVIAGTKVVADMAKNVLDATIEAYIQVKTVAGGASSATPTILAPGPAGQNRKMEKVKGWFVNGTSAEPPVATGTPWEAPEGYDNTNWWEGTTWSLGSSVPLPKGLDGGMIASDWSAGTYSKGMVKVVDGVAYRVVVDSTNQKPPHNDWEDMGGLGNYYETLVDNSTIFIENSAVQESGGEFAFSSNPNYNRTDYIDVEDFYSVIISKGQYAIMAWYDENKVPISAVYNGTPVLNYEVVKPANAKYAIFNNRKVMSGDFYVNGIIRNIPSNLEVSQNKRLLTSENLNVNIVNVSTIFIENSAVQESGGEFAFSSNPNYNRTDYIDVEDFYSVIISKGQYAIMAWYDENKVPISAVYNGTPVLNYEVVKPANAKYAIFNNRKVMSGDFYVNGIKNERLVNSDRIYHNGMILKDYLLSPSGLAGKKLSVMGDSLSPVPYGWNSGIDENTIWWGIVINNLGLKKGIINAMGGTSISNYDKDSFVRRFESLDFTDTDILIIEGGMNDLGYRNIYIGDFDYDTPLENQNTSQFIPAVRYIIETVTGKYPNIQIVLCTIPHRTINQPKFPWKNPVTGHNWVDFNNAICKIGSDYQLSVIKFSKYINHSANDAITYDGVHPKALGQSLMAKAAIETLNGNI